MDRPARASQQKLRDIARRAMLQRGLRGFEGLDVGARLRVELVPTDVERGFIDFVRAHEGT